MWDKRQHWPYCMELQILCSIVHFMDGYYIITFYCIDWESRFTVVTFLVKNWVNPYCSICRESIFHYRGLSWETKVIYSEIVRLAWLEDRGGWNKTELKIRFPAKHYSKLKCLETFIKRYEIFKFFQSLARHICRLST